MALKHARARLRLAGLPHHTHLQQMQAQFCPSCWTADDQTVQALLPRHEIQRQDAEYAKAVSEDRKVLSERKC